MLLRGGAMTTPSEKVSYARGMIDFLDEVAPPTACSQERWADYKSQGDSKDYYLLHEELETFNSPCYLLEMVAQTQPHGLDLSCGRSATHDVRRQLRRQGG